MIDNVDTLEMVMENVSNSSINGSEIVDHRKDAITVILFGVIFITIAGNVLVSMAVCRFANLRTHSNLLILGLSFTDLALGVFVMPLGLISQVAHVQWRYSSVQCLFFRFMNTTCCGASIISVCFIALDRYIALKYPLKYRVKITRRVIVSMITLSWCFGAALALGQAYLYDILKRSYGFPFDDVDGCLFGYEFVATRTAIFTVCVAFLCCVFVIITLYCCIFRIAYNYTVHSAPKRTTTDSPTTSRSLYKCNYDEGMRRRRTCPKAIRTTGAIVGVFLICWVPFNIGTLFYVMCGDTTCYFNSALQWLGYANSAINPALYTLSNRKFRIAFKKILLTVFCCNPSRFT